MPQPIHILRQSLGPRVLKTGLAVFITLSASHWLAPDYAVYAGLAAFLAVQPSLVRSRATMQQQLAGNMIGAVLGAAIAATLGHGPLAMSAGVVAVLVILRWFGLPESINLAVVMLLFVLDRPQGGFLGYGLYRIGAVFFGTVVAYLVNRFVAPPDYRRMVYRHLEAAGAATDALLDLVRRHLAAPASLDKPTIKAAAAAAQAELDLARHYLRLEEEDGSLLGEPLHKGTNSIAVFTERLMDVHKVLLGAGDVGAAGLAAVDAALAALRDARQAVYARLTSARLTAAGLTPARLTPARGTPASTPGADLAGARRALGALQAVADRMVALPAERRAGLALHTVLTNLEHMLWRLESIQRLLEARQEQPAVTAGRQAAGTPDGRGRPEGG